MSFPRATWWLAASIALACAAPQDRRGDGGTTGGTLEGSSQTTSEATGPASSSGEESDSGSESTGEPQPPEYDGPAFYPPHRVHSPVTNYVAEVWLEIAARGAALREDVFLKTGASSTVNTNTLHCFATEAVDLGANAHLDPTLQFFLGGDAAGSTPFDRNTLAAESGRGAGWAIEGDPSPIDLEVTALSPRLALVHFGTNDMGFGATYASALFAFFANLSALVDGLLEQGIVPVVFGITRRGDNAEAQQWVGTYNAVIRGLAQERQVPFIDMFAAIDPLPGNGLSADGLHLEAYALGACVLDEQGLTHGYNVRNLIALEALDRAVAVLVDDVIELDEPAAPPPGDGSAQTPIPIPALPYAQSGDTQSAPQAEFDEYVGCGATQSEAGGELIYRLELDEPTAIRAVLLDSTGVDVDLHLLDDSVTPQGCLARDDSILEGTLDAGIYHFVVDSFDPGDGAREGRFELVVVQCDPDDAACEAPW